MVQRIAGLAAGAAALAVLLTGLFQGAPTTAILERLVAAWLVFYGGAAILGALTRIALAAGPSTASGRGPTRGMESADRD